MTFALRASRKDGNIVDFEVPRQSILVDEGFFDHLDASERDGFDNRI